MPTSSTMVAMDMDMEVCHGRFPLDSNPLMYHARRPTRREDHRFSDSASSQEERREDEGWERTDGRKPHPSAHGGSHSQYQGEDRSDGGSWLPQQQVPAYKRQQQEGEEKNDEGWQTIGEKKHHGRPQQRDQWRRSVKTAGDAISLWRSVRWRRKDGGNPIGGVKTESPRSAVVGGVKTAAIPLVA